MCKQGIYNYGAYLRTANFQSCTIRKAKLHLQVNKYYVHLHSDN